MTKLEGSENPKFSFGVPNKTFEDYLMTAFSKNKFPKWVLSPDAAPSQELRNMYKHPHRLCIHICTYTNTANTLYMGPGPDAAVCPSQAQNSQENQKISNRFAGCPLDFRKSC